MCVNNESNSRNFIYVTKSISLNSNNEKEVIMRIFSIKFFLINALNFSGEI